MAAISMVGSRAGGSMFVGRELELGVLRAGLASAVAGHPRVVLVEGGAGFGKSSLLNRLCDEVDDDCVVRAAGEECESSLAYGVLKQMVGHELSDRCSDPLVVGAKLRSVIERRVRAGQAVTVVVVDDLQWVDDESSAALLFWLRRLEHDRVLVIVSTRGGELGARGDRWDRFVSGDPRAIRVPLGGLGARDVQALADLVGAGPVSMRVASRLVWHAGGSPAHLRALLEELGAGGLRRADDALPAPRAFCSVVLSRVSGLSDPARQLVIAAAVLGDRCELRCAAELATLEEPLDALEELIAAGLVSEEGAGAGAEVRLHPLTRAAIYGDLGPARRRALHATAARLMAGASSLAHRVAAATFADHALATDLTFAASVARSRGQSRQAAVWLEQAAGVCGSGAERGTLLLEALDILVRVGDAGSASELLERMEDVPESRLRSVLATEVELLAGRGGRLEEERLSRIWDVHDPVGERIVGLRAATALAGYVALAARPEEAIMWARRALAAAGGQASVEQDCRSAIVCCEVWLSGREGLQAFGQLTADRNAAPNESSDMLSARGQAMLMCDQPEGAIEALRVVVGRGRAGDPSRSQRTSLALLAEAEYRVGRWDDSVAHSELAVSLSHDADCAVDCAFAHAGAMLVPAARDEWDLADAHLQAARTAGDPFAAATTLTTLATASAALADARGDLAGVLDATAKVRRTGRPELFRPGIWDWQHFELDALISLGRLDNARTALAELQLAADRFELPSAQVSAAGLRGRLAAAEGDEHAADAAFALAWQHADGLPIPFRVAWLGLADGRRLRRAGRHREAITRLQPARALLADLAARPYLERCESELERCAVHTVHSAADPTAELTKSELAVARLVATGLTNKQVASELFVTVKTIEFHLGHVYDKLGVRSRVALVHRMPDRATTRGKDQGFL